MNVSMSELWHKISILINGYPTALPSGLSVPIATLAGGYVYNYIKSIQQNNRATQSGMVIPNMIAL